MNVINGRVVLKESGVGIPDLLVVVYDVDPNTRSEEAIPTAAGTTLSRSASAGWAALLPPASERLLGVPGLPMPSA